MHCTHTIYECSSLTKFNSTLSSKCGKFWHPKNDSIGGQKLTLSQSPNPVYDARRLRPSFTKFVVSPRSVMLDIFYNIRVMRKEALTSSLQENIHWCAKVLSQSNLFGFCYHVVRLACHFYCCWAIILHTFLKFFFWHIHFFTYFQVRTCCQSLYLAIFTVKSLYTELWIINRQLSKEPISVYLGISLFAACR